MPRTSLKDGIVWTEEEVIQALKKKAEERGREALCEDLGISKQRMCDLFAGRSRIGETLAGRMNLELVHVYRLRASKKG